MVRHHEYAQHFLQSPRLVGELIGHSNIRKNDIVYDLGAGSGIISTMLAKRCKQVVAVEVERDALRKLRENTKRYENVKIVESDILQLVMPDEPYKIFANIPFDISSAVVRKFTAVQNPPKSMYLIAQRQFARKLVPGSDHFTSQLAAIIGPWFSVKIRRPLKKTDFTPPPAVDTVLLEIKRREEPMIVRTEFARYEEFISRCFSEQKYFTSLPRDKAGISPELRPSQLTLEQCVALYATMKE